jgi:lysophospholipase L1-like esterase
MDRSILLGLLLLFIIFHCYHAEAVDAKIHQHPPLPRYPMIDSTANVILSPEHLQPFLRKLKELKTNQRQQVRIAHLGDSHVQADFMPSRLRRLFQEEFGDAGRGLVFFYAQAGTHGPLDYQTDSPQEWIARRRIFQKEGPAIGISGMGIRNTASVFSLGLSPKKVEEPLHFNKVTLFHDGRGTYTYQWEIIEGEQKMRQAARKQFFLPNTPPQSSVAYLPEVSSGIRIHGQDQKSGSEAQIYGLLLEDETRSGVLFNMMGVNGATYYHFNRAEYFTQQMGHLQPDLILITLGTNEAIQSRFYPDQFRKEIRELLQKLKGVCPESNLLLMTNPNVLVRRQIPAPYTLPVREIIREVAKEEGAAVWDWYAVMGGEESIRDWYAADLAYKDFIHFTEKGYILQARLLFESIMKEYRAGH